MLGTLLSTTLNREIGYYNKYYDYYYLKNRFHIFDISFTDIITPDNNGRINDMELSTLKLIIGNINRRNYEYNVDNIKNTKINHLSINSSRRPIDSNSTLPPIHYQQRSVQNKIIQTKPIGKQFKGGLSILKKSEPQVEKIDPCNSCCWYPIDPGLFLTAHSSGLLSVWSSNYTENFAQIVSSIKLSDQIYQINMSKIGVSHTLVAIASKCNNVKLYDIRSGAIVQSLLGHSDVVRCAKWAPFNEFSIVSGSNDHSLLLWDIRRAGSIIIDREGKNHDITSHSLMGKLTKSRSEINSKTSHSSPICNIHFMENGHLMSMSMDGVVTCWEAYQGSTFERKYDLPPMEKSVSKSKVSSSNNVLFYPTEKVIHIYDGSSFVKTLEGHLSNITACQFNESTQELYSSSDSSILTWKAQDEEIDDLSDWSDYE